MEKVFVFNSSLEEENRKDKSTIQGKTEMGGAVNKRIGQLA